MSVRFYLFSFVRPLPAIIWQSLMTLVLTILLSVQSLADTISWNNTPQTQLANGATTTNDTRTATPGPVTVTTSVVRSGTFNGTAGNNQVAIQNGTNGNGYTGTILSVIDAASISAGNNYATTFTFSEPVYDVSFQIQDIDGGPNFVNTDGNNWNDYVGVTSSAGAPTSVNVVSPTHVNWNAAQSRLEAISDLNFGNGTNNTFGTATVNFAGPITSITITHYPGPHNTRTDPGDQRIFYDDITFKRRPQLAVSKTYTGATGSQTFNFSISNSGTTGSTSVSATATAPSTAVVSAFTLLNTINTNTQITETSTANWVISPQTSSCTDSNGTASGNGTAAFAASVSGYVITVPAANIRPGAVITCAITNVRVTRTVVIGNLVNGGEPSTNGSFRVTLSAVNNTQATTVTYSIGGTATAGSDYTALTGTVTIPAGQTFVTVPITVIDNIFIEPTETVIITLTGVSTLNASLGATVTGTVNITDNDVAAPAMTIVKTANTPGPVNVGQVITYTYRVRNTGNVVINNVSVNDVHNGNGTLSPRTGETITLDTAPLNDSTDVGTNGIWQSLAIGDEVTFTSTYTVVQADIDLLQ
jgi:uncharacterized repeat protein (TIGR01451 family)